MESCKYVSFFLHLRNGKFQTNKRLFHNIGINIKDINTMTTKKLNSKENNTKTFLIFRCKIHNDKGKCSLLE